MTDEPNRIGEIFNAAVLGKAAAEKRLAAVCSERDALKEALRELCATSLAMGDRRVPVFGTNARRQCKAITKALDLIWPSHE